MATCGNLTNPINGDVTSDDTMEGTYTSGSTPQCEGEFEGVHISK